MKQFIHKFYLLILFITIFGLSYILQLIGIGSQSTLFIYLLGALIICVSFKIIIAVLSNDYQNSKLLVILYMTAVFYLIILLSKIAAYMFTIQFEVAFQLISFGITLGNIGKVFNDKDEKKMKLKTEANS